MTYNSSNDMMSENIFQKSEISRKKKNQRKKEKKNARIQTDKSAIAGSNKNSDPFENVFANLI